MLRKSMCILLILACMLAISCSEKQKEEGSKDADIDIGILTLENKFVAKNDDIIAWDSTGVTSIRDLYKMVFGSSAYTIRKRIPKTSNISNIDSVKMKCYTTENITNINYPADTIMFYKHAEDESSYYFTSQKIIPDETDMEMNKRIGGPIFLIAGTKLYNSLKESLPDPEFGIRVLALPASLRCYFNVEITK